MFIPIAFATVALAAAYLYRQLHYKRFEQHRTLPQLPPHLLMGHLLKMDELIKSGPDNRHPDYVFDAMLKSIGRPPIMYVDFRPFNAPMVLITKHDIAEQVSRATKTFPTSVPKVNMDYMSHLIGSRSILAATGDEWKALRKRYSPAFGPQHLMTLLPCILDKTAVFVRNLESLAQRGEEFSLVRNAINLTFDIIGAVGLDEDLHAQADVSDPSAQKGELVQLYVELFRLFWDDKADTPWWLTPSTEWKRIKLVRRVDFLIKDIIKRKHAEMQLARSSNDSANSSMQSRSILSLSLADVDTLTMSRIEEACHQVKTFLLAGHDTTSIVFGWTIYWLCRCPRALAGVRKELDDLLGPDATPDVVRERLSQPDAPELVRRMPYISAVIKESMRLNNPSSTARTPPSGSGFNIRTADGVEHCLDGMTIYNGEAWIMRDPDIYGETANTFRPERWLNEDESSKIPASAWRAFERGPRNCIGQDFALIELRVIIAFVARRFEFTKVGIGEIVLDGKEGQPVLDEHGIAKVKSDLYYSRQINARPVDDIKMTIKVR